MVGNGYKKRKSQSLYRRFNLIMVNAQMACFPLKSSDWTRRKKHKYSAIVAGKRLTDYKKTTKTHYNTFCVTWLIYKEKRETGEVTIFHSWGAITA